jgi:hypothetical protein
VDDHCVECGTASDCKGDAKLCDKDTHRCIECEGDNDSRTTMRVSTVTPTARVHRVPGRRPLRDRQGRSVWTTSAALPRTTRANDDPNRVDALQDVDSTGFASASEASRSAARAPSTAASAVCQNGRRLTAISHMNRRDPSLDWVRDFDYSSDPPATETHSVR